MREGTVYAATESAKKRLPEYLAKKKAERCKAKGGVCPACPPKPSPVQAPKTEPAKQA